MPTPYSPGGGSVDALRRHLGAVELVGDLDQDAGAVAHQRVGADRAAVVEVLEDLQALLDDRVRLLALDVGDEADAAGVVLVGRRIEARRPTPRPLPARGRPARFSISPTAVPRLCHRGRRIPQRSNYDPGRGHSVGRAGHPSAAIDRHELDLDRDLALDRRAGRHPGREPRLRERVDARPARRPRAAAAGRPRRRRRAPVSLISRRSTTVPSRRWHVGVLGLDVLERARARVEADAEGVFRRGRQRRVGARRGGVRRGPTAARHGTTGGRVRLARLPAASPTRPRVGRRPLGHARDSRAARTARRTRGPARRRPATPGRPARERRPRLRSRSRRPQHANGDRRAARRDDGCSASAARADARRSEHAGRRPPAPTAARAPRRDGAVHRQRRAKPGGTPRSPPCPADMLYWAISRQLIRLPPGSGSGGVTVLLTLMPLLCRTRPCRSDCRCPARAPAAAL